MENIEREKSVFGFYVEELQQGRRELIREIVEEHVSNISNYVSNKIRKSEEMSPVSKRRVQLKLMQTNSISQEIMKEFEDDIKEMEHLDEQHFRIPPDMPLTPPSKYTVEELEEKERKVKELELKYKQNQAFLARLTDPYCIERFQILQKKMEKDKEIFAHIDSLMKVLDISKIEKLYKEVSGGSER